jgi:hypothetical protein
LILLEHHWAVPLRDAVVRAGGFRISDGLISLLDLVETGLPSAGVEARCLEPAREEDHLVAAAGTGLVLGRCE